MRITPGTFRVTTAVLLLAVATSCAQSDDGTGSPTRPQPSSEPPTSSAAPTDTDVAGKEAADVVRDYYSVRDKIRQDSGQAISALSSVATGVQLKSDEALIENERKKGRRQTGDTAVAELTVQSVSLDNSDPKSGKVPNVVVDVCWDVSKVDLLDKNGKSVVSPSRPDRGWTRYTVANYHWADHPHDGWRISSGRDLEQAPCKAS